MSYRSYDTYIPRAPASSSAATGAPERVGLLVPVDSLDHFSDEIKGSG